MELGMVGLGKMGANMTRRLLRGGHKVTVYDVNANTVSALVAEGARGAASLEQLPELLKAPRAVWVMVPSGKPTDDTVGRLAGILAAGDIVVDGGNSNYKDSLRHGAHLAERKIRFVDAGVSGGVWGLENGYSMMIGGEEDAVNAVRPVFETLAPAPDRGWGHVGPRGAGHYAKMVHNGIEYGLMQAYAEGFEILRASPYDFDLGRLTDVWNSGGVIRSWLLELAGSALKEDPELSSISDAVPDSGEGRWTLQESVDLNVPAPVLYAALMTRLRSRQKVSFQAKVLAALRHQFGGHADRKDPS